LSDLVIIGENLSRDIVKLISIIEANGGCIDEVTLHCIIFLKGDAVGLKYIFEWNGFVPYSRELSNKIKLIERLGIVSRTEEKICLGKVKTNEDQPLIENLDEIKELLGYQREKLIDMAKEKFFRKN